LCRLKAIVEKRKCDVIAKLEKKLHTSRENIQGEENLLAAVKLKAQPLENGMAHRLFDI